MAARKKKQKQSKEYKPTEGKQTVSADGKTIRIGGSVFSRTVLPSVAKPSSEVMELEESFEAIDRLPVSEVDTNSESA